MCSVKGDSGVGSYFTCVAAAGWGPMKRGAKDGFSKKEPHTELWEYNWGLTFNIVSGT